MQFFIPYTTFLRSHLDSGTTNFDCYYKRLSTPKKIRTGFTRILLLSYIFLEFFVLLFYYIINLKF